MINIHERFSLLHLNIRSISNKFDSLKYLIDTLKIFFQLIGLTETWLAVNNNGCFAINNHKYLGYNKTEKKGVV